MSKDNFATPLTRFFRVSACKATALHHLFQNKKLFNCLHKLSNGIDCAKNCPTRRNFAPNLHFPWFFNAKIQTTPFCNVYVPARRLYEFDILRRFALLNARQTHNFWLYSSSQSGNNKETHKNSGKHHAKQFWRQCLPTILWRNTPNAFGQTLTPESVLFLLCVQLMKARKYRSTRRTRPQNGKTTAQFFRAFSPSTG